MRSAASQECDVALKKGIALALTSLRVANAALLVEYGKRQKFGNQPTGLTVNQVLVPTFRRVPSVHRAPRGWLLRKLKDTINGSQ